MDRELHKYGFLNKLTIIGPFGTLKKLEKEFKDLNSYQQKSWNHAEVGGAIASITMHPAYLFIYLLLI